MTVYVTVKQDPIYYQMSLEEFLFGTNSNWRSLATTNKTNTRTYRKEKLPAQMVNKGYFDGLTEKLEGFVKDYDYLYSKDRSSLYKSFKIPKKSGGYRQIDAPQDELKSALYELKKIFEVDFGVLYHTSAFAYVKDRCIVDCLKRHQENKSRWFAKFDLHNFFGSTTKEFVVKQFGLIYPFSEVLKTERGMKAFTKAIDLAFLNGGLPQGTPISPIITNTMMIPIDHKLANTLRDFNKQNYVFTRYADDFQISSRYGFKFKDVENLIIETLKEFDAPFELNKKKTRYGSSAGRNWNLGLMLNKDNEITVGHQRKRHLKAALTSYATDKLNGIDWEIGDVQELSGQLEFCRMVEKKTIEEIVNHLSRKFNVDIQNEIKADLKVH